MPEASEVSEKRNRCSWLSLAIMKVAAKLPLRSGVDLLDPRTYVCKVHEASVKLGNQETLCPPETMSGRSQLARQAGL